MQRAVLRPGTWLQLEKAVGPQCTGEPHYDVGQIRNRSSARMQPCHAPCSSQGQLSATPKQCWDSPPTKERAHAWQRCPARAPGRRPTSASGRRPGARTARSGPPRRPSGRARVRPAPAATPCGLRAARTVAARRSHCAARSAASRSPPARGVPRCLLHVRHSPGVILAGLLPPLLCDHLHANCIQHHQAAMSCCRAYTFIRTA